MLDLIVSTIAFFVAVYLLNRYLDEQGMSKGMTRSMLVFLIASVVSVCVPMAVDFVSGAPKTESSDISQLMKILSELQGR